MLHIKNNKKKSIKKLKIIIINKALHNTEINPWSSQ